MSFLPCHRTKIEFFKFWHKEKKNSDGARGKAAEKLNGFYSRFKIKKIMMYACVLNLCLFFFFKLLSFESENLI